MKNEEVLGNTDTQKNIFKTIFNRAKSVKEMASVLNCAEKTISNNLPSLKSLVEEDDRYEFLKNFNSKNETIYSITNKIDLIVKTKPKIYKYTRSKEVPYIIINLPPPPKGYDKWVVIPLGDIHFGSDSCDVDGLVEWIQYITDTPNVLVILSGDLIENANKESPGASVFRQLFPPQEQKEKLINLLAPIAHRIIYVLKGNHGDRSVKRCYLNPEKDIANALGIEFFDGACYADLVCESNKWNFMSFHGSSSASTLGGRLNAVLKKREFHSAQITTMNHVHDLQSTRDYEIVRDPENLTLKLKKRYFILCGTVQKYWNSYAEEWVLPPNKTGLPKIDLYCSNSDRPGDYHATI